MDIIRNSDIAQLILGYLRDQNLDQAAYSFCKASPYLTEEYQLLKKGLRTMSLGSGTLVDIIKEHCQIKSKISQVIYVLPLEDKERILKQNTLVGKISYLIKALMKEKRLTRQDNNNQKHLKRTRSNSSDDIEIQTQGLQSSVHNHPKRRRTSDSYFLLDNSTMINESITDEEYDDNDNDELSSSSNNDNDNTDTSRNDQVKQMKSVEMDKTLSSIEPLSESKHSSQNNMLSETILKKTKFQDVLVENINKVLQISLQGNSVNENSRKQNQEYEDPVEDTLTTQLDEMIKQILDTTEKDPIFDEVIEEVINITSSADKSISNQGSRVCPQKGSNDVESIKKLTSKGTNNGETNTKLYSSNKSTQMTPQREIDFSPVQFAGKISIPNTNSVSASLALESNELNDTTCSSSTVIPVIDSNLPPKLFFFNSNDTLGTLTNDSTLLSCTNFNNIQTFNSNDQVFIDLSSGQMSIPVIMTNDNVTLPILINSSDIQQQSDNTDSNSLINKNSNKQNVDQLEVQQQITLDNQQKCRTESTGVTTRANSKNSNKNNVESTNMVDSNIINMEKSTPNDSNIRIPVRSFSTPRRRTSHVRVLNFGNGTPNKEQEQNRYNKTLINNNENIVEQAPPSPIANNVEIQASPNSLIMEASETASNSNSLDFDMEGSNQTVIQRKISVKRNCVRNISKSKKNIRNQPKSLKEKIDNVNQKRLMSKSKISKNLIPLKNKRKAGKNKVKNEKIITVANDESMKIKNLNKTLEKSTKDNKEDRNTKGLDPLEEWNRMRATFSNPNWDQHLRILQSQSQNIGVPQLKKRSKRKEKKKKQDISFKKISKTKKSDDNKINNEIIDLENNKQQIENKEENEKILTEKLNKNISSPSSSSIKNEIQSSLLSMSTHNKGSIKFKIVTTKNKSKEIQTIDNVKDNKDCEKKIDRKQQKKKRSSNENVDNILTNKMQHIESDNKDKKGSTISSESSLASKLSENKTSVSLSIPLNQQPDGSNNMAVLLETPFKITDISSSSSSFQIPITPRFVVPSVIEETPITKIMKTIHYQQQTISTTDHKQQNQILIDNLSTPNFAITPGAGLVTSVEKETPGGGYTSSYSNRLTDYSSGGSYYKPDESDDLDKHLDRLLIAERKRKTTKLSPVTTTLASELIETVKSHNHTSTVDKSSLKNKKSDIDISRPKQQHQLRKQNMIKSTPSLLENNNSNSLEKHNMNEFSSLTKRNHLKCFSSSIINSPSTSNFTTSVIPDDPVSTSKSKCNLSLSDVSSSEDEAWKESDLLQKKFEDKGLLKTIGNDKNSLNSFSAVKQIEISNEKEKQLHELEKKRLRMKEKLKGDFPLNATATAKSVTTMISTSKVAEDVSSKRKPFLKKTTTSKAVIKQKRNSTHTKKNTTASAEAPTSFAVSTTSTKTATTICSNRNQGIAIIAAEQKFSNSSKVSVAAVIETNFSIPPSQAPSSSCDEISKDQMDVLKALNLSAKKLVEPPPVAVSTSLVKSSALLVTPAINKEKLKSKTSVIVEAPAVENDNAVTEDIFEREHISKLRSEPKTKITTTDDSRESAESVKIRNAAMALTTIQKKLASQINHDKTEIIEQKIKSNTNISIVDHKEQQKQEKKLSFFSSSPEMKISKTNKNIATVKISNELAKRSCKLIDLPRKTPVEGIQRKCSKRKVKLTPKAKSLSMTTSPKTIGRMKLYQTRTPRAIETRLSKRLESTSANKRKNKETISLSLKTPSKSKRATKRVEITKKLEDDHKLKTSTTNSSLIAPILIKQPKVILETMTIQQLGLSPIKQQEQIKKDVETIIQNTNENILTATSKNKNKNKDNDYNNDCDDEEEEDNSENEDDEDPYDECEMITIDENDSKHFLKIIHTTSNENMNSKNPSSIITYDKKTLQTEMKIYLNNTPHVIKINDEIELFSKNCTTNVKQQNILTNSEQKRIIRNIPKKREKSAHILQYIDHNISNSSLLLSSSSQVTSKASYDINQENEISTNVFDNDNSNDHDNNQSESDVDKKSQKYSASAPCKPKFRLHYKDRNNKEIITNKRIKKRDSNATIMQSKNTKTCLTGRLSENIEDNEQPSIKSDISIASQIKQHEQQQLSPTSISSSDEQSKTLRQEDIYAVLSHLHGTDEAALGYR